MKIIHCNESHAGLWDDFLNRCDGATFYHLFGWKHINEQHFSHKTFYLAVFDGSRLSGVLPLVFIKSRLFGRILCSLPFVNFAGPCSLDPAVDELLLEEAEDIVDQFKIDYLEIRTLRKADHNLLTSEHKVSLTIALEDDPEMLWKAFTTKHRTNIRRAQKNNLSVKWGREEMIDTFYGLLSESWRNLGTPIYRKDYFRKIISEFHDLIKIFVVYHNDIPIATAFNGYYRGTVEGLWAAVSPRYKRLQPNYTLYWEMIKDACENGYNTYHLGRSTVDSGGEAFKKKWNATPKQLYWQYHLGRVNELPMLNVNNSKFKLAINTWRRLPLGFTNILGPIIAKNIP